MKSRKFLSIIIVIFGIIIFVGIGGYLVLNNQISSPRPILIPTPTTKTPEEEKPVKLDEVYICKEDSECILVQDGPCSCNMGGRNTAINKKYFDYWQEKISKEEKDTFCLAVISTDPTCSPTIVPKCIKNKCVLQK